ncbi:DUF4232 domain-containing protein [Lentzea sp. NPDC003310]|uniref:DUF4232 domain-containing protein n=1 Tax=Lentzea sp. NPDC003310 TaxID=3154447 RepID=UPI0033ADB4FD
MRSGGRILALTAALALLTGTTVAQAEVPSCDSGVRFSATGTGAAMGLRLMAIEVTNCGTEPLQLNGYPRVKLLDADRQQLDVAILEGSGGIAAIEGFDDPPQPITVAPGDSAKSAFLWRNTHASVDPPQLARHADVAAVPDGAWEPLVASPQEGSIYIDLGSTGRLGVRAWYR